MDDDKTEFASSETPMAAAARTLPQRPSSCPLRKRRSILADTFKFTEAHANSSLTITSTTSTSTSTSRDIDTSSLSLLSATSALVSEGAVPPIDSEHASTQSIFSPPSSSSPSSPVSPSSSSSSSSSASSPTEPRSTIFLDLFSMNTESPKKRSPSTISVGRQLRHSIPLLGPCRKRSFEDAIELTRPLGNDHSVEYLGWFGSIKRRKIHHFPTRWTSALSPSPYVKLMDMRDFWDVMRSRLDLSWLDLWAITASGFQSFQPIQQEDAQVDVTDMDAATTASASVPPQDLTESVNDNDKGEEENNSMTKAGFSKPSFSPKLASRVLTLREASADTRWHEDALPSSRAWSAGTRTRRKTVVQHPNAGVMLRGLWEEEERSRRQRQMIPDTVHRPNRSKILNRKPIPRPNIVRNPSASTAWIKLVTDNDDESSDASSSSSSSSSSESSEDSSQDQTASRADQDSSSQAEELVLKKKPSPTAAIRSNALSEGYDLNEYKPWRDGTITPHRGCIRSLYQIRNTMFDPWPKEESRAKDECTRILHRMREQLNVVINLQIHLRSMIKTSPSYMSFLLSIRHPGQVSVELLSALYGPQFIQTSAFKAIEQLLWGEHQPARIEHHPHYGHPSRPMQQQQQQQQRQIQQEYRQQSSSYTFDHSHPPEYQQYQYHGDDEEDHEASFENGDNSGRLQSHHHHQHHGHSNHGHDHHHHEHFDAPLDYQDPQYHYHDSNHHHDYHHHPHHQHHDHHHHHHHHPGMDEDGGECKFVQEFSDPSYQDQEHDPIMAAAASVGQIMDENPPKGIDHDDDDDEEDEEEDDDDEDDDDDLEDDGLDRIPKEAAAAATTAATAATATATLIVSEAGVGCMTAACKSDRKLVNETEIEDLAVASPSS
ncbi:hypothetical protein BGX31_002908 [Mortierella sp. GBA43]|nr:hypothetical protein BGX31_002908 [Mortierella sp. GBA43]